VSSGQAPETGIWLSSIRRVRVTVLTIGLGRRRV
jgi:hypothetical protein